VWAFTAARDQDSWLYHGGFLLFAVATTALITAIVQPGPSPLKALLSFRPARWVGQISYGLYLWHWPVVVALSEPSTRLTGWNLALLRLAVTFTAATLSYYLVELPVRRKRVFIGWHARVAAPIGMALTATVILVATAGATAPSGIFAGAPGTVTHTTAPPTTVATLPSTAVPIPTRWVLVGDSVASSASGSLPAVAAKQGISFSAVTRSGCPMTVADPVSASGAALPWIPNCTRQTAAYETRAVASTRAQVVVWLSSWEMSDHLVNGKVVRFGTRAGTALLTRELDAALARFHAAGASRLVLLTYPPRASHSDQVATTTLDRTLPPKLNRFFRQFAAKHPSDVTVVDLASIVCPGGWPCPEFVDGIRPRPRDGGHFEGAGPAWLAPKLVNAVAKGLRKAATAAP
jgi:SGNH domain-containing protein